MKKNNKTKQSLLLLVSLCSLNITAQEVWNIDQCMAYAVEHNHIVKQRHLEADNYRMDRMKAIGQFLPGVSGNVSAQYNFGRSVDPETNTYISKSTFNNGYSMEASIPIFRGGSLINQVRKSKANLLLGKAALQEARDNTALETFQAYIDALYYYGTTRLAKQKLAESDSLLYKTRRQETLGLKGMADVAQMEAQQASDAYNLTHQQNLYETAMLTLKQKMNFPIEEALLLDTCLLEQSTLEQEQLTIEPEQYEAQKEELQKLVQQAVQDREGYLKESIQMEKKVASDSLAYHVTRRKYEEGLMTSLDVQNNAATLLESQTGLLQSKLTYLMKCRLVDYYKGQDIIRNNE